MHYQLGCKFLFLVFLSIFHPGKPVATASKNHHRAKSNHIHKASVSHYRHADTIATGCTSREEVLAFAKSLIGTPYRFGSTNPLRGFDCSGFVNYVFNHFGINLPRGSADFGSVQGMVNITEAKFGDLIFFTGTGRRSHKRVGHMGIVVSQPGEEIRFIHSSSGDAHGVTETTLYPRYIARYVKTLRIFRDSTSMLAAQ